MKAIILAGGKGTRLRPLTHTYPKGLVPLVNKAFLEYQIELIRAHGIYEIILSLNYMADEFIRHFGNGAKWGISIGYAVEERPLGTAGAAKNAGSLANGGPALILNGDVLTCINLSDILSYHKQKGGELTIALVPVENPSMYGLVITDSGGRVLEFLEKPGYEEMSVNTINAGVYVIEPSVFQRIPAGREVSFEREVFPALLREKVPVYGYSTCRYWLDIGTLHKYLQGHLDILDGKVEVNFPGRRIARNVFVGKSTRIHKRATLLGPVVIGDASTIEAGAEVGPWTVIGNSSTIAEGVSIRESVVHGNVFVGKESKVRRCIIGMESRIGDECNLESVVIAAGSILTTACMNLENGDSFTFW